MKNAAVYKKKIKGLLKGASKRRLSARRKDEAPLRILTFSILQEDATRKDAQKALDALEEEFVDFNELRVAMPREVAECIGKNYPRAHDKAEMLKTVLSNVFGSFNRMDMDSLAGVPKRELQRRLTELALSPYAAACVAMFGFGVAGVPVDDSLVGSLEMNGCVEPGSDVDAVQSLLNRTIAQKDAAAAHEFFRTYVEKNAKPLGRKRAAEAKAKAKAEAEAKAKAEAETKAKAEAEAAKAKKLKKTKKVKKTVKAKKVKKVRKAKTVRKKTAAKKPVRL